MREVICQYAGMSREGGNKTCHYRAERFATGVVKDASGGVSAGTSLYSRSPDCAVDGEASKCTLPSGDHPQTRPINLV